MELERSSKVHTKTPDKYVHPLLGPGRASHMACTSQHAAPELNKSATLHETSWVQAHAVLTDRITPMLRCHAHQCTAQVVLRCTL
jgi:hypothetical protein